MQLVVRLVPTTNDFVQYIFIYGLVKQTITLNQYLLVNLWVDKHIDAYNLWSPSASKRVKIPWTERVNIKWTSSSATIIGCEAKELVVWLISV